MKRSESPRDEPPESGSRLRNTRDDALEMQAKLLRALPAEQFGGQSSSAGPSRGGEVARSRLAIAAGPALGDQHHLANEPHSFRLASFLREQWHVTHQCKLCMEDEHSADFLARVMMGGWDSAFMVYPIRCVHWLRMRALDESAWSARNLGNRERLGLLYLSIFQVGLNSPRAKPDVFGSGC